MIEKELIIIGSGPAGLRAAYEAREHGIEYLILEKGETGQAWQEIRENMPMLSPCHPQRDWTSISIQFPIWKMDVRRPYCSAEEFVAYLNEFARFYALHIRHNTHVFSVRRKDGYFLVETNGESYRSLFLYNATGFFGNPYTPDIPGFRNNPRVSHSHYYHTPHQFRNQRVVVIGGGNSAAEVAIELSGYSQVFLLTRRKLQYFSDTYDLCHIRGISESFLKELIKMELIRHISDACIKRLEDDILYYNDESLKVHAIICATGYRPVLFHLKDIPFQVVEQTKFPDVKENGESLNVPGLFFGGPLAYTGPGSLFIHGFIRIIADSILEIKSRLDAFSRKSAG